jgi:hypothetical protein
MRLNAVAETFGSIRLCRMKTEQLMTIAVVGSNIGVNNGVARFDD